MKDNIQNKDWTGNFRSAHAILGARNYAQNEREENDYYATDPKAVRLLLERETFSPWIWECACGEGHLAKELEKAGYCVFSSDLIDRGYGETLDFLKTMFPPMQHTISSQIPHTRKHRNLSNTLLIYLKLVGKLLCF